MVISHLYFISFSLAVPKPAVIAPLENEQEMMSMQSKSAVLNIFQQRADFVCSFSLFSDYILPVRTSYK